jgi:cytochrome c oxidase assembly protein subunit 15
MITVHRIAVALCFLTFALIVWGGHVNTTRSGMAFPDWPTSNQKAMITYAPTQWLWQGDRFWEHGHRLFATLVGMVTVAMTFVAWRVTPQAQRPTLPVIGAALGVLGIMATALIGINGMSAGFFEAFMVVLFLMLVLFLMRAVRANGPARVQWLSFAAFAGVCLQGTFGGLTVRNNLPDWTSTIHGMLAEIFLMIVLYVALSTSSLWKTSGERSSTGLRSVRPMVIVTWSLTVVQFLLGAMTRHTDAWSASINFPHWTDYSLMPSAEDLQTLQVAVHFIHRSVAYVVAFLMLLQAWKIVRMGESARSVRPFALTNAALVLVQIGLGAWLVMSMRAELPTTLHVMTGVALLAMNTIVFYMTIHQSTSPTWRSTTQTA